MNVQRGDVVLVDYPYSSGTGAKVRPVLVIQNDRDNQRLLNTIVVQITSVNRRALEPTQLLIELDTHRPTVWVGHWGRCEPDQLYRIPLSPLCRVCDAH
jgi:mRNA-degrading endonuclease toxin of MazEF toxin-antitoxin module